ncbi:hypothetical protein [Fructobacillus ficulneus]|uniref:Uncharacterized protein n=1 Tax=Fructobacillus ficulneus TaxID=157463 RepID=A0A0K8MIS1_9LACO|nr:hypothetical protein [Fructobacillus ficulneus]GAP00069.1 hypothetical protein FFIC_280740 [Fructobacillus ficulneus]
MTRILAMYAFHLKQYCRNSYFVFLVLTSTLGILFLKYLLAYARQMDLGQGDIVTAGIFGMWSSTVTAAGSLHFQRSQGVLVYLVNSGESAAVNLLALVSSAATFGLLAFPLAQGAAWILNAGRYVGFLEGHWLLVGMFWLGSLPISYVLAQLFLLSKNAFVYEELFVLPLMVVLGLFSKQNQIGTFGQIVPVWYPIQVLQDRLTWSWSAGLVWLAVTGLWLAVAAVLLRLILKKIHVTSEIEVF